MSTAFFHSSRSPLDPPTGEPLGSTGQSRDEFAASLYSELRAIAAGYFASQPANHTLQPTALVNEALVRMLRSAEADSERWASKGHFLAVAATAMRNILVDCARAKAAKKRGGGDNIQLLSEETAMPRKSEVNILELNDAIDRLAEIDERAARVVELRFFAGLTIAQTATVMGVSDFTIEKDWRAARAFLASRLTAIPSDEEHRSP